MLGELGWKTYPINGVRRAALFVFASTVQSIWFKLNGHCNINEISYSDVNRSEAEIMTCFKYRFTFFVHILPLTWEMIPLEADNEFMSLKWFSICC